MPAHSSTPRGPQEGPPPGQNARLRAGIKIPRPHRERDRMAPVSRSTAPGNSHCAPTLPSSSLVHPASPRLTAPEAPASSKGPSSRDWGPGSWNKAPWASSEHLASGGVERAFYSSAEYRPSAEYHSSAEYRPSAESPRGGSFPASA